MKQRCPKCKKFIGNGYLIDKEAKTKEGQLIIIKLYQRKCEHCGYVEKEKYQEKVKLLNLLPV